MISRHLMRRQLYQFGLLLDHWIALRKTADSGFKTRKESFKKTTAFVRHFVSFDLLVLQQFWLTFGVDFGFKQRTFILLFILDQKWGSFWPVLNGIASSLFSFCSSINVYKEILYILFESSWVSCNRVYTTFSGLRVDNRLDFRVDISIKESRINV